MFKLEIEVGNDAFTDGMAPYEITRILKVAGQMLREQTLGATGERASGKLLDANGNSVGGWTLQMPGGGAGTVEEAAAAPLIAEESAARLDELLRALGVHPKGAPAGEGSAGGPRDEWSMTPVLRPYDMDDGSVMVVRPTGVALMLARGEMCLPMELSALALAELARGEWHELIRQARHMVEVFDEIEAEGN